jgi:hypothetical protein
MTNPPPDSHDFETDLLPWWKDHGWWIKNIVTGTEGPIMTQLTLIALCGVHLRIHLFHRADDGSFHNHTRSFMSIGVCGEYLERRCDQPERTVKRGTVTFRRADTFHAVDPIRTPCATLALTTPNLRPWQKTRRP